MRASKILGDTQIHAAVLRTRINDTQDIAGLLHVVRELIVDLQAKLCDSLIVE